jgi:hypothetical protein
LGIEVRKRSLDDPQVDEFLAGQTTYLFHQPVWARALSALGHEVAYWCLQEDERIVLAQPAIYLRLGFFNLLYGGLPYGFAVGNVGRHDEFVGLLAEAARREGIHRIRLSRNHYDPDLAPAGYTVQEHMQHVLHFAGRGEGEVWRDLKRRVRHDVRVAQKRGVVVKDAVGEADRETIFRMYCQTMARNRTYIVWPRALIVDRGGLAASSPSTLNVWVRVPCFRLRKHVSAPQTTMLSQRRESMAPTNSTVTDY